MSKGVVFVRRLFHYMRKEATDKMEAKLDKATRMVRIAMDFTPYLSALRGRHVVCDEANYERHGMR